MSIRYVKELFQAYVGSNPSAQISAETDISTLCQVPYRAAVTDGGTAGTAAAETVIGYVKDAGKVVSIYLSTPVGVTADNTNNATFTVGRRTAGGSRTTIGTLTTNVAQGNLTAFSPVALTLTAANVQLAAGDVLTLQLAKASSGVAIAAATAQADVTVIVEKGST